MTNIKCSAVNCGFNKGKYCNKHNVKVEGLFSRSKLGTFCQSFTKPIDVKDFNAEMANEMYTGYDLDENLINVSCSANYCIYNEENKCTAPNIKVGFSNAKYRSETQCDSFKLR